MTKKNIETLENMGTFPPKMIADQKKRLKQLEAQLAEAKKRKREEEKQKKAEEKKKKEEEDAAAAEEEACAIIMCPHCTKAINIQTIIL
eukprot:COSAG02_NODE_8733_length_2460_cov_1.407031_3_plen_89_part_00